MLSNFPDDSSSPATAGKPAAPGVRHWWLTLRERWHGRKPASRDAAGGGHSKPHRTTVFFELP